MDRVTSVPLRRIQKAQCKILKRQEIYIVRYATFYEEYSFTIIFSFRNLSPERADELAGSEPDYAIRDLYDAISEGNYPSYTMYIQVQAFAGLLS